MNILQEYKIFRHNISLVDAHIIEIHAKKVAEEPLEGNNTHSLKVEMGIDESSLEKGSNIIIGYVKAIVDVTMENKENPFMQFIVVARGAFERQCKVDELDNEKFKNGVKSLAVSLLLPYIRASLASISGLMNAPIAYIPTIDILKSMSENMTEN